MKIYSITTIETAINYWRRREIASESFALCPSARALADLYGQMIFERCGNISESSMSAEQIAAITAAEKEVDLPKVRKE